MNPGPKLLNTKEDVNLFTDNDDIQEIFFNFTRVQGWALFLRTNKISRKKESSSGKKLTMDERNGSFREMKK